MIEFIGGLISGMVLLLVGQRITNAYKNREDRGSIVADVAQKYRDLRETNQTDGLDGMIRSGVLRLHSHEEIEQSLDLIKKFGHRDPLSTIREQLAGKDIHHLFVVFQEKKLNVWKQQEIDKAIAETKAL